MVALFLIVFGFMWLSLHFSKYKKRSSSCCGGSSIEGHNHDHADGYSCHTCPDKDRKDIFSGTKIKVENLRYTTGSEK